MKTKLKALIVLVAVYFAPPAFGGELEDLRKDLQLVQSEISAEEARYQAAKAQMERSQVVAQFLFPALKTREAEIRARIEKLEAEARVKKDSK